MNVRWTDNATLHIVAIYDHIAENSPFYARKMVDRLLRRSDQISAFPKSGRRVPEFDVSDLRELIEGPYRMIYRILPDQIDVVAVVHGTQQLPEDL